MAAPVDAHYLPIPSDMPGYDDQVVMAGGTFIQGSSIELSADARSGNRISVICRVVCHANTYRSG